MPTASMGEGLVAAFFALGLGAAACFLLRPEIRRRRGLSFADFRRRVFAHPLGRAAAL